MTSVPPPLPTVSLRQLAPDTEVSGVLALVADAFAHMDGRIDPPSSVHDLTADMLARSARDGEVWAICEGDLPVACVVLTLKDGALYLGKLAVRQDRRGRGLARRLVDQACRSARQRGLHWVELQTRVELTENQAAFAALGFIETARTAHPGYLRPTSITYRKRV
jgi:ribosomal protein S18 acetylase RimI-like enzyme